MTYTRGWFGAALWLTLVVGACSAAQAREGFDDDDDQTGADGGDNPATTGDANTGITGETGPRCKGRECQRAECAEGEETSLTGVVYTPDGKIPLYNVIVYIPLTDDELPEITHGASCERCGATALSPLTSALTNERGEFTLKNVPVGENVPVVIQVGKWRRVVEVDIDKSCKANEVDDGDLTLPKNQGEGSMPKIAIAMGGQDPVQCLLSRIGVDEEEFTMPEDDGMIHMFAVTAGASTLDGDTVPAAATNLWSSETQLADYDMVLLACHGSSTERKDVQANMDAYLNAGGRVFATHYHSRWFQDDSEAAGVAEWGENTASDGETHYANVDTSFPKGQAFSAWLEHVDALQSDGTILIKDIGKSIRSPLEGAQGWIATNNLTQFMTFNTPVGVAEEEQCGRAVVSDVHVSTNSGSGFMSSCGNAELSAQEKALLFLIMDLSSCVQADEEEPLPPVN